MIASACDLPVEVDSLQPLSAPGLIQDPFAVDGIDRPIGEPMNDDLAAEPIARGQGRRLGRRGSLHRGESGRDVDGRSVGQARVNADRGEHVGVGRRQNLGHRAARRQARGENALSPDAEFLRQRLREAGELGRFARPPVLMAPVEPVPAAGRVGAARLVRIGDDEAELVGEAVHLCPEGEIFRILGASMQHEHEREVAALVIGR